VAALRTATERICTQLADKARAQARRIRAGDAGELTEADVVRIGAEIADAARAQLDGVVPDRQSFLADPELQATRREAAALMAAAEREVDALLREAWRARHGKAPRRRWRR